MHRHSSWPLLSILMLGILFPVFSYGFCIKATRANLRAGPGSKFGISWMVGRYMPFIKVNQKGNWFQVADFEGQRHWVYNALLTQKYGCAVVRVNKANVRNGPGTNFGYSNYRTAIKYETFRRTEKKGNWYKLSNDLGFIGWVHQSNLWVPIRTVRYNFK